MKKLFTFFAVATFVVALSSCGGNKTEEATATEEVSNTEENVVVEESTPTMDAATPTEEAATPTTEEKK